MPSRDRSESLARAFAILRGAMLVVFAVLLLVAPEKVVEGGVTGPARSLALVLGSRTLLLGVALVGLAIARRSTGLAWVLLADAALQLFDTGLAIVDNRGAVALVPLVLGALDAWAGLVLRRARPASS